MEIRYTCIKNSSKIYSRKGLLTLERVESKNLHICEKCGNVMANRVLKRDLDNNLAHLERILQCIVCRHWIPLS